MARMFVSYRRSDSQETTGRIRDHLASRFGTRNVFADVDSIPAGQDFLKKIEASIRSCDVVIGPKWTTIADRDGRRRLDNSRDVVRLEIEIALREKRKIIPI